MVQAEEHGEDSGRAGLLVTGGRGSAAHRKHAVQLLQCMALGSVLVVLALSVSGERDAPVTLERPPQMVRQLEAEAKEDVENDATAAGLHALSSRDSLAATLTGGLKRQLQNMQNGDNSLLKRIEKKATGKRARGKKTAAQPSSSKAAAAADAAKAAAEAKSKHVAMATVTDAVGRDRIHEMRAMRRELEKVAALKRAVQARSSKEHNEVQKVIGEDSSPAQKAQILQVATAKALIMKAKALEKKANSVKQEYLSKNFKDYDKIQKAEEQQRDVLNKHAMRLKHGAHCL